MSSLKIIDILFLFSLISTWLLLLVNMGLAIGGYFFHRNLFGDEKNKTISIKNFPKVSILIPAHNEGVVIKETINAMLKIDYPNDQLEIIVINDNSSDDTGEILAQMQKENSDRKFIVINTTKENGGKGKSNALNIGYKVSTGEYLVIYDADNTPESMAVKYLVNKIEQDKIFGAVIGKFRTRNKNRNLLTKFINIETLSFQWMAQAGRWQLFKLCTIPGTNFIVRREIIEKLNGWDVDAIAEDTEISFRIYEMGYKIGFIPLAVTWEQEPESLKVWFKQRTRWAMGNVYVLLKYFKKFFKITEKSVLFDLMYFFSVYFLFLSSVIISDVIFLIGIFTDIKISISGNYFLLWVLAYLLFILEVSIALTMEKAESSMKNIILVFIMYFSYCQLWMLVAIKGFYIYFKTYIMRKKVTWYKTERF